MPMSARASAPRRLLDEDGNAAGCRVGAAALPASDLAARLRERASARRAAKRSAHSFGELREHSTFLQLLERRDRVLDIEGGRPLGLAGTFDPHGERPAPRDRMQPFGSVRRPPEAKERALRESPVEQVAGGRSELALWLEDQGVARSIDQPGVVGPPECQLRLTARDLDEASRRYARQLGRKPGWISGVLEHVQREYVREALICERQPVAIRDDQWLGEVERCLTGTLEAVGDVLVDDDVGTRVRGLSRPHLEHESLPRRPRSVPGCLPRHEGDLADHRGQRG